MATIGTFTRTQNGFIGDISTLTINAKRVTIVETTGDSENAPTHRIYLGKAEIGAGWAKRSQEQRVYISLKLDDPSLPAPLFANLCADEDGKTFQAIWSRSKARSTGRQQVRQQSRRD
ncbi:DUF736 domain-containing protein [Methylorubrum sp. SL192]|uniref:DUF736 domain-containing protein n=1 Tax=Methylorubrum sp. SL192 TaxID=2995167 RepID=UPI0022740457|nr:DUF736 domain-containing protein [Methylorubrum sp. SL192]MCY1640526.1 DUF736 domain-containing protein [Methylorubrum sp. SL192]